MRRRTAIYILSMAEPRWAWLR